MQAVTHASALVLQQPSRIRVGEGNRTEWRLFGVEKLFGVEISRVSALGEVYLSRCSSSVSTSCIASNTVTAADLLQ